jgi:hypothetical protein
MKVLEFILQNLWTIAGIFFIIWRRETLYQSLVLDPLRGDNGITQMDELAKYVLVSCLVYMIYREGKDTQRYFESEIFLYIGGAVAVIAGLKKFKPKKHDDNKVSDTDNSHS